MQVSSAKEVDCRGVRLTWLAYFLARDGTMLKPLIWGSQAPEWEGI